MQLRPVAVPNKLIVQLGDTLLARQGALVQPLTEFYRFINEQLS